MPYVPPRRMVGINPKLHSITSSTLLKQQENIYFLKVLLTFDIKFDGRSGCSQLVSCLASVLSRVLWIHRQDIKRSKTKVICGSKTMTWKI